MKINKNRPDIIKLHEKDPELANKFKEVKRLSEELKKEMRKIEHMHDLIHAKKNLAFDELEEKFTEDLSIISPEGKHSFHVDGEEVYITRTEEDKIPEMPDFLKEFLKGKIPPGAEVNIQAFQQDKDGNVKKFFDFGKK